MLPFESIIPFFAASVLLALAPGPDNLFVLTQAALYGRRAGILVTLGLCTGLLVHTAAVTLGVAMIFQTSPTAFAVLKTVGALYLLYLAWGAWQASLQDVAGEAVSLSSGALYRRGIVMNVTNPKVSIFFLAFLPQFTDPDNGPLGAQMLQLGGWFQLATLLIFGSIALLAGSLGQWLRDSPKTQLVLNRVAAVVFIVLALKLLIG